MKHLVRKQRIKAFTLIELLVVIAIISILAAILFPVFARARENARRASCMSNIKQIALSSIMYSQDYDERLVPYQNTAAPILSWYQILQPYIKNNQVLFCPSDSNSDSSKPPIYNNISYGWNWYYLCYLPNSNFSSGGLSLAAISAPSETVMVGDSQGTVTGATAYGIYSQTLLLSPPRHLGGMNMGFVDGHVKWFNVPGVLTATNDNLWNTKGAP